MRVIREPNVAGHVTGLRDDGTNAAWRDVNRPSVVDRNLFKAIGLDQLLQRSTAGHNGFARSYRTALLYTVRLSAGLMIMQVVRMYLAIGDLQTLMHAAVMVTIGLNSVFKGHVMIMKADRLRDSLDVTLYGYTAGGRADPSVLRRSRNALSVWLRAFATYNVGSLIVWTVTPWFIDDLVPFAKRDGTVGNYRQTVLNWWYPVSEETYNRTPVWTGICAIETAVCFMNVFCWMLFECYTVTMCVALSAQFRTVSAAYGSLGRRLSSQGNCIREIDNTMADRYYEELINHIKDNEKIIKKYDEFVDIVKPAVLLQITIGTSSVITFVFLTILAYLMGWSILSATVMRYVSSVVLFTQELFIYCYIFVLLETAKSSVNFALYSCDWTEMDLKFKKTVLMAMHINSAHNRLIKLSPNSIVNLEMFARVMKFSFSIVSVLLNTRDEKATSK